jgi:spermidine synthase
VAVPWHLATTQAVRLVRDTLRPDGVYVLNVIDQPPLALLRAQVATVAAVFDEVALVSEPSTLSGQGGGNSVLVASQSPVRADLLSQVVRQRDDTLAVLSGAGLAAFAHGAQVLTDDLAPVDQLLTPYVTER